jgi:hypothetical protein
MQPRLPITAISDELVYKLICKVPCCFSSATPVKHSPKTASAANLFHLMTLKFVFQTRNLKGDHGSRPCLPDTILSFHMSWFSHAISGANLPAQLRHLHQEAASTTMGRRNMLSLWSMFTSTLNSFCFYLSFASSRHIVITLFS